MIHNWKRFNNFVNENNEEMNYDFAKKYEELKALINKAEKMSDLSNLVEDIKLFNKNAIHFGTKEDSMLGDDLLKLRTDKSKEILNKY